METSPEKFATWWKWLATGGCLSLAIFFSYRWLNPAYEPPAQPVPNAYNDLVSLGGQLAPRTGFYDEVTDQELASIVSANASVLDKAREALRKDSMVALDWKADQLWFPGVHVKRFKDLRQLARGFAAEAFRAQSDGESRLAIQCGLDNLHLAQAMSRGGLGTDWLTGIAVYGIGLGTLRETCTIANAEDCQLVLKDLPVISESFDPPADVTIREWHFWRRINGVWVTFLSEMAFSNNRADFEKRMETSLLTAQAREELLRVHYAIRAFALDEGRLPKSLAELAGRLLSEVPSDPCSDGEFIYQVAGDKYLLYSIGPNGIDDGGLVHDKDVNQGDLVLEPYEDSGDGPK